MLYMVAGATFYAVSVTFALQKMLNKYLSEKTNRREFLQMLTNVMKEGQTGTTF